MSSNHIVIPSRSQPRWRGENVPRNLLFYHGEFAAWTVWRGHSCPRLLILACLPGRSKTFASERLQGLCFDIGHARQVDPTMSEASAILRLFSGRIQQLHVSEVNTQSKHDPLTFESTLAFQKVSHLIPQDVPIILESRVAEFEINEEIQNALNALSVDNLVPATGD